MERPFRRVFAQPAYNLFLLRPHAYRRGVGQKIYFFVSVGGFYARHSGGRGRLLVLEDTPLCEVEVRGQRSGNRGQRTEDRGQKSDFYGVSLNSDL